MKKYILLGVLVIAVPLALYAQNTTTTTTTTVAAPDNCVVPSSGVTNWAPVVSCLLNKINNLENRIKYLESAPAPSPVAVEPPVNAAANTTTTTTTTTTMPSICSFASNTSLRIGANSADVLCMKRLLKEKGLQVDETAFYDESTYNAVKEFQTKNGLVADGVFGAKSKAAVQGLPVPQSQPQTQLQNQIDTQTNIQAQPPAQMPLGY